MNKSQTQAWQERLNELAKEQWDNAMNKHFAGEWMTFNRIDLVRFIHAELTHQREEIIERLDSQRKSVRELFPEAVVEPTKEFAEFVLMKDQYNRALSEAIESIKNMES